MGHIRGLLLDAGGVLTRPVGGRWNPRYDFEELVLARHPGTGEQFATAFAAGQRMLDESPNTADRTEYHLVILGVLGIDDPDLLPPLEAPPARPAVELFPDVAPTSDDLAAKGFGMAVVSDTWAGLDRGVAELGIGHHFATVVMSEVLGCRKPDPRTYDAGRAALGLDRAECLFVDDDPDLVAAAIRLGYRGATLDRGRGATLAGLRRLEPAQDLAGDDLTGLLM